MDHGTFDEVPDVSARTVERKRKTVEFCDDGQAAKTIRASADVVEGRGLAAFSRSISFRNLPVPSPTIVQRAMPHLQRMGLDGLLQYPWNITSPFVSQEFLDFQSKADAFPSDHRLHKVSFSQELFARLYHLPSTGYTIGQDADPEYLAKFFCKKGAPFGWHFEAVADPQLSAVFQILNPIFTPERPHQITKSVAMHICKAWEDQEKQPDWAYYVWATFCRLKEKKKRFYSPFLLHVYHEMGLLCLEEKQVFENIQNGVMGFSGAQSRGRLKHAYARGKGGIRVGKVSRISLPTLAGIKAPSGQGRGYISTHARVHPGEIAASGVTVETQVISHGDWEESDNQAAVEVPQSDPDARDPLEKLVQECKRQRSLYLTISKTLGCEGDEEVLPKIRDISATQKSALQEILALKSDVQQEKARSERAEDQNNELRVRLASLQSQFFKEATAKRESQDAQQMEMWKRQQQKAEDLRETNLWLKGQNDGLQLQVRLLLTQIEENKVAQEKELTATAGLLGESELRRQGLVTHILSLQTEMNALQTKLEQQGQIVRATAETLTVLTTGLNQTI